MTDEAANVSPESPPVPEPQQEPQPTPEAAPVLEAPATPEPAPLEQPEASLPEIESSTLSPSSSSSTQLPPPPPTPLVQPIATSVSVSTTETAIKAHRAQALEKRKAKKRTQLERILALAQKKRSITNNDVQLLLGVSDATASRYLSEFVKAGRLKRMGKQKRPTYELSQ